MNAKQAIAPVIITCLVLDRADKHGLIGLTVRQALRKLRTAVYCLPVGGSLNAVTESYDLSDGTILHVGNVRTPDGARTCGWYEAVRVELPEHGPCCDERVTARYPLGGRS